jgi:hypothetical protein
MTIKTTKTRGEDIRAGQFVGYPEKEDGTLRVYRTLRNERDRRGGGGALQIMDRNKNIWWRGYEGYDWLKLVARPQK